jgi:hypothetical protein
VKLALLVALAGCNTNFDPPPSNQVVEVPGRPSPSDKLFGNLMIGNDNAALKACRPGHRERVFVEVDTSLGKLRFDEMQLYYNPSATADRGDALDCKRLDRSWGGGIRSDGTAYWRGTLDFTCMRGGTPIVGKLDLDCGAITIEERAQLDQNRNDMKREQAHKM